MIPTIPALTETAFLSQVRQLATLMGYKVYHTRFSIKSDPGFPDLVLAKPRKPVIFAELKREDGLLTSSQLQWLGILKICKGCLVFVWRPSDWDSIERILKGE